MLSGHLSFPGDSDQKVLKKVRRGKFKFEPEEYWNPVSEALKELITSLLVVDVKERPSAEDLLADLLSRSVDAGRQLDVKERPSAEERSVDAGRPASTNILRREEDSSSESFRTRFRSIIPKLLKFQGFDWFKRCSLEIIASLLAESSVAELRAMWFEINTSRAGRIGLADIERSFPSEGCNDDADAMSLAQEKASLFEIIRKQADKPEWKYTTFIAAMLDRKSISDMPACKSAFKFLDLDGDGYIRWGDLSLLLQSELMDSDDGDWQLDIGNGVTSAATKMESRFVDQCKNLIKQYDENDDSALSCEEWVTILQTDDEPQL
jgi:Ca2+-binding EF-hand superfamily protein